MPADTNRLTGIILIQRWVMMTDNLKEKLKRTLDLIMADRHKLVLLIGDFGSGKTQILKELAAELEAEYLNLVLTDRLLTHPRRDYKDGVTVHRLIDEICDEQSPDGRILLVDNVEMLFSPDLGKINPVETFKRMSRQRPVILALPMRRQGDTIEYSTLDRADHMSIPLETYPVIDMSEA